MTDIADIIARAIRWRCEDEVQEATVVSDILTALQERGFVVVKQADLERINAKSDAILANMLAASPGSSGVKE